MPFCRLLRIAECETFKAFCVDGQHYTAIWPGTKDRSQIENVVVLHISLHSIPIKDYQVYMAAHVPEPSFETPVTSRARSTSSESYRY